MRRRAMHELRGKRAENPTGKGVSTIVRPHNGGEGGREGKGRGKGRRGEEPSSCYAICWWRLFIQPRRAALDTRVWSITTFRQRPTTDEGTCLFAKCPTGYIKDCIFLLWCSIVVIKPSGAKHKALNLSSPNGCANYISRQILQQGRRHPNGRLLNWPRVERDKRRVLF